MPLAKAADDTAINYELHGRGQRVLLLLAGQSNNRHWWDCVLPDFAESFLVVTIDYRGTGDSGKPDTDSYSTRGFAEDAMAVLDAIGADRFDVYGTSMGGRVAQWLAADNPGRVNTLVLGCTSPGQSHGVERSPEITRALGQRDKAAVRKALLELMYSPEWLKTHPGPYNTIGDRAMPSYALRRHRKASAAHDSWAVLPSISAPTLVVHGTDDIFNPTANAPLLADRIPGAKLELIEGARHAYFEEYRAIASPLVLDFLLGQP
ncbi:alpha/beta hydrolase [Prauserella marina]|uniref:Pimeloyl-ACP methyl ester carboxylesterase n=1 Tax=Prauserella marina TaxID=530584 RepID=A0A222VVR9_9PSEU|nr:alpha/beta fold hydrolase [Prauserella marina]ASR37821.1 alpha/beta hydrolase [Prauserella marina]PWV75785.1 pimeloyl-ACP methyl ester carboxylesterase [Prauserella marina]SDD26226.1 Pimeloyl-ACP methyl ester carboxylesterase [Prauserella marina]